MTKRTLSLKWPSGPIAKRFLAIAPPSDRRWGENRVAHQIFSALSPEAAPPSPPSPNVHQMGARDAPFPF
jgi:hypothetical protein